MELVGLSESRHMHIITHGITFQATIVFKVRCEITNKQTNETLYYPTDAKIYNS